MNILAAPELPEQAASVAGSAVGLCKGLLRLRAFQNHNISFLQKHLGSAVADIHFALLLSDLQRCFDNK